MAEQHPLTSVAHLFDDLHHKTGIILTAFGHDPMPGSIAAKELATPGGAEHLKSAYSQGSLLIEAAADQLAAFVRGITQPVLAIAPWTNARGVLETAAISVWLLDDHVEVNERIRRSYAFRCEGLAEQVKFSRAAGNPTDTDKAERRLDRVLNQAKTEGVGTRNDDNGKLLRLSKPMPSVTELVRDHLNDEPSYRLFSAMTHAHLWALQQLAFKKIDSQKSLFLEKSLSIEAVGYLASTGLKAFRKPIECKCRLFGWPVDGIALMFDEWMKTLALIFHNLGQSQHM
jgi:hypothetical protein